MPNTKVRVILKTNNISFNEILPFGFETIIEPILSTKEKVIANSWYLPTGKTREFYLASPKVIAPIGTFEGFRFKAINGEYYDDKILISMVGYVGIKKIFAKVQN